MKRAADTVINLQVDINRDRHGSANPEALRQARTKKQKLPAKNADLGPVDRRRVAFLRTSASIIWECPM